jgi:hypothetical protein
MSRERKRSKNGLWATPPPKIFCSGVLKAVGLNTLKSRAITKQCQTNVSLFCRNLIKLTLVTFITFVWH